MIEQITWSPGITLEQIERQVIGKAFNHFQRNKTRTAQALGISVRTLDTKLEEMKATDSQEETRAEQQKRDDAYQLARARGHVSPDGKAEAQHFARAKGEIPSTPSGAAAANKAGAMPSGAQGNGAKPAQGAAAKPAVSMPKR